MDKKISTTTARLDDEAAMARFLTPIPNGDQLAKVLENGEPVCSRAYDDESLTARFVASDGTVVMCFTVDDITIDQAEMIAAECALISGWNEVAFRAAVAQALGDAFDRV